MKKWLILAGAAVLLGGALASYAASQKAGRLRIATPGMVLEMDISGHKVSVPPLKDVPLPVGVHKLAGIQLHAREVDSQGRVTIWRIDGRPPFGKLAQIEVAEDQTTTVEGGEPIQVRTPVAVSGTGATKAIYVSLLFIGKSEEQYRPVIYKGRVVAPNPKLRIVDENGKVLSTGQFEYG